MTAAAIGRALLERKLDAVEVTEFFLDRLARHPDPSVCITTTAERARAEARASAARYVEGHSRGPLDGVPLVWKDLIDIAGTTTTCGSALYRDRPPAATDAAVVANAAAAGLVTLGKTNLSEFAFSGIGANPHYGTPQNPVDRSRAPGGSSSGSAVAVAAGLVPIAVGTDTGGSIRIPAAFNGLVGYKPSEGRVPTAGVQPLSLTLDVVGPIARSAADCVLLERALRRDLVVVPRAAGLHDMTLVVPQNVVFEQAEAAVVENFERALERLARTGVAIERRPIPAFDALNGLTAKYGAITPIEAFYLHQEKIDGPSRAKMDRRIVRRIEAGRGISAAAFIAIREARKRLQSDVNALLKGPRFLALPTVAIVAPELGPLEADEERFMATNALVLRNTALGNFFNLPGFAFPSGVDAKGLPTSIQVAAASGEDEFLVYYALGIDRALSVPG
ncbi:MAG: amidase [Alphaproteobacteria bacterium]|nr:amidase [Alphaproteobacteria bacterium]